MIRAAAMMVAATVSVGAWSALLGRSALWIFIAVAVACAVLASDRLPSSLGISFLLGWPVVAVLTSGAPPGRLWPTGWGALVTSLADGLTQLTTLGPARVREDPWPAAVWLLLTGALWMFAAALSASRTFRPFPRLRAVAAFGLLVTPWGTAMALRQTDEASWQGAALLLAALLWFAPRRAAAVRPVVAFGVVAALASMSMAHLFGPRAQWFALDRMMNRESQFKTLDTAQTYGPLRGRRSGATMLEVTAPRPALWRMQVLERFGWRGWEVSGGGTRQELPEPAAEQVDIDVRVRGLRNDMVISPGSVLSVTARGKVVNAPGEGKRLIPAPKTNDTYRVRASLVRVNREALMYAVPPTDPRLRPYVSIGPRWGGQSILGPLGRWGAEPEASPEGRFFFDRSSLGAVGDLARQLAAGARTQLEVVERVERFLVGGGRFRYDTDVDGAERVPLADFLLRDRVGYCQHFAGGAALLLRLAGVPTRVVGGFATGKQQDGRFNVRDADAHAWIEVYFQGLGWVAFNPTPAAADAEVAGDIDPLAPPRTGSGGGTGGTTPAVALLLVVPFAFLAVRRMRRRHPSVAHEHVDALLERVAARTGEPVRPSTTLSHLRVRLAGIGPNIAEVAAETERARFAPEAAPAVRRPVAHVLRALAADLGPVRAALVVLVPSAVPLRVLRPVPAGRAAARLGRVLGLIRLERLVGRFAGRVAGRIRRRADPAPPDRRAAPDGRR